MLIYYFAGKPVELSDEWIVLFSYKRAIKFLSRFLSTELAWATIRSTELFATEPAEGKPRPSREREHLNPKTQQDTDTPTPTEPSERSSRSSETAAFSEYSHEIRSLTKRRRCARVSLSSRVVLVTSVIERYISRKRSPARTFRSF